jgi:hypothetical protein
MPHFKAPYFKNGTIGDGSEVMRIKVPGMTPDLEIHWSNRYPDESLLPYIVWGEILLWRPAMFWEEHERAKYDLVSLLTDQNIPEQEAKEACEEVMKLVSKMVDTLASIKTPSPTSKGDP